MRWQGGKAGGQGKFVGWAETKGPEKRLGGDREKGVERDG